MKHDVTQSEKLSSPQTKVCVGFLMTAGSPTEAVQKSIAELWAAVLLRQHGSKGQVLLFVFQNQM